MLGSCCWGAKTVKYQRPFTQPQVRLICGRNSLDYSFGVEGVRAMEPNEVGTMVLAIWNERVAAVRERFHHVRTVVLMKGPGLLSGSLFEVETLRYDPERVDWRWNKNGILEGFWDDGSHRFSWQPHGSQFTIVQQVPDVRHSFSVKAPPSVPADVKALVLEVLGFDASWVEIQ